MNKHVKALFCTLCDENRRISSIHVWRDPCCCVAPVRLVLLLRDPVPATRRPARSVPFPLYCTYSSLLGATPATTHFDSHDLRDQLATSVPQVSARLGATDKLYSKAVIDKSVRHLPPSAGKSSWVRLLKVPKYPSYLFLWAKVGYYKMEEALKKLLEEWNVEEEYIENFKSKYCGMRYPATIQ